MEGVGWDRRERWTPFPMMTWELFLGLTVLYLTGSELLFLCPDKLIHGPWLPYISTALFLPNHKPLAVRGMAPGFLLSPVGSWLFPVRSVEALFWFWSQDQGSFILCMRLCIEHGLWSQTGSGLAQSKTLNKFLNLSEPQFLCK